MSISYGDAIETIFHPPECWFTSPTQTIMSAFSKTTRHMIFPDNIICAVSGGWDSDIMLDLVYKIDKLKKVKYVFYNTGLEMRATKDHIKELEKKYSIKIDTADPKKSIPAACKEFGQPFFSKKVAEYMERLQRHNFQWEMDSFEVLLQKYPKCKSALRWWCNEWGAKSRFNISKNTYLKEFIHENPPQFKISSKCCTYGKIKPAQAYAKRVNADLTLMGIRKAEGGARGTAYKSCFNEGKYGAQHFPLFYFSDKDKQAYDECFGVTHSRAYSVYGCERTGCAACPFGSRFEQELEMLRQHEPDLYIAAMNIFGDSIEYTRAYRKYKAGRKRNEPSNRWAQVLPGQISLMPCDCAV
ncbi:MAG: phosphoadenosine phosphosulfate reductase family protein [Defluviitaleaceae bacterium]|nr:phosphoadenosine phosphosulfate reductase family protein [Defluviitaleaceae bacterium]